MWCDQTPGMLGSRCCVACADLVSNPQHITDFLEAYKVRVSSPLANFHDIAHRVKAYKGAYYTCLLWNRSDIWEYGVHLTFEIQVVLHYACYYTCTAVGHYILSFVQAWSSHNVNVLAAEQV